MLLGASCSVCGCKDTAGPWVAQPFDPASEQSVTGSDGGIWPFAPRSMRIHPLTRWIGHDGSGAWPSASVGNDPNEDLEVRLEFLDADELETRAIGVVWLELRAGETQLSVGPIDLRSLELNRRLFEAVTRTYRLGVVLAPDALPSGVDEVRIRATMHLPDGRTLQDSMDLPRR